MSALYFITKAQRTRRVHKVPRAFFLSFVSLWLFLQPLHAHEVRDRAGVFPVESVAAADLAIREWSSLYGAELVVECFPKVPDSHWRDRIRNWFLRVKDPENRRSFYIDWAKRSVRESPKRIHVLVCQEPDATQIEVAVGRELRQRGLFSEADAAVLRQQIKPLFQERNFSEGLSTCVNTVGATLKTNRETLPPPPATFPLAETLTFVLILSAIWLGVSIVGSSRGLDTKGVRPDIWNMESHFPSAIYCLASSQWLRRLKRRPTTANFPAAIPVDSVHAGDSEQSHG